MANNYCAMSSLLVVPAGLRDKAAALLVDAIKRAEERFEGPCGIEVELTEDGVWLHSDESADTEHAAVIAEALVDGLEIDEPFIMSWAYTCSRPIVDQFGGGACVVRRGEETEWFDAQQMAMDATRGETEKR